MANLLSIVKETKSPEAEFSQLEGIMPAQFYRARHGSSEVEPWRRLMVAMLVDAVRCFYANFDARQPARWKQFTEVRSWIFSDADSGPFSFRAVCDALEYDPEAVRKRLNLWAVQRIAGEKPRMIRRPALRFNRVSPQQPG